MQRKFAIIGHRAQSSGKLNLSDLAGTGGRIDVLARAVNTALFLSHGVREDTSVVLHLQGGPGPARRVCFDGGQIRGVRPDERAISGYIAKALKEPVPAIGHIEQLQDGLWHSGGDLQQTMREWAREGVRIFALDAAGDPFAIENSMENSVGFILSDDQPFSAEDWTAMENLEKISLGQSWLQGHSCIAILHHQMDAD